jgi:hypothetical protein
VLPAHHVVDLQLPCKQFGSPRCLRCGRRPYTPLASEACPDASHLGMASTPLRRRRGRPRGAGATCCDVTRSARRAAIRLARREAAIAAFRSAASAACKMASFSAGVIATPSLRWGSGRGPHFAYTPGTGKSLRMRHARGGSGWRRGGAVECLATQIASRHGPLHLDGMAKKSVRRGRGATVAVPYRVEVTARHGQPEPWGWEVFRRGETRPIERSVSGYTTETEAWTAGTRLEKADR